MPAKSIFYPTPKPRKKRRPRCRTASWQGLSEGSYRRSALQIEKKREGIRSSHVPVTQHKVRQAGFFTRWSDTERIVQSKHELYTGSFYRQILAPANFEMQAHGTYIPRPASTVSDIAPYFGDYKTGLYPPVFPASSADGPFNPSTALVKLFLKSSGRVLKEFRKSCSLLPGTMSVDKSVSDDRLVEEVRSIIADSVHGTLETLAFRAAAVHEEIVQVSNPEEEFVAPAWEILDECFPVRPYDIAHLLKELHSELLAHAKKNPVLARWGRLHAGAGGIYLQVTVVLPRRLVQTPRATVVGGVEIE